MERTVGGAGRNRYTRAPKKQKKKERERGYALLGFVLGSSAECDTWLLQHHYPCTYHSATLCAP